MVARLLPFTIAACLLLSASSALLVSGYPSEGEREGATDGGGSVRGISDSVVSSVKDSGKLALSLCCCHFHNILISLHPRQEDRRQV